MKILVLIALSFLVPEFIQASSLLAGPIATVDRLTCRQAQSYVHRYRMYWKATEFDGPIPITFITPVSESFLCGQGQIPESHVEPTRDQSRCLVGYRCKDS